MLTPDEKVRARHHMGYPQVQEARTFLLGYPVSVPTMTMIEGSLDKVAPAAEGQVRRMLTIMDALEEQMLADQELLAVVKVDEIEIRQDEFDQILKQYQHWQRGLGNLLGVPPNPYDQRFLGAGGGINVSVDH